MNEREAIRETRGQQVLEALSAQIFGDERRPGSGLNPAYSEHGRAMCVPVLAGGLASLHAAGIDPRRWAR